MDPNILQYSLKLKKLLRKLLEPNFQTRSDADFNILLSHLAGKDDPELGKTLLGLDLFTEWIIQACSYWEKNTIQPPSSISRFTLELLSLMSKNEQKFIYLNNTNIYVRLFEIMRVEKNDSTPSLKLASVKLLFSFLEHKSGFDWIQQKDSWMHVLQYCLTNPTIYIIRDSSRFIYELLEKAVIYDEQFLNTIIQRIMLPLTINELKNTTEINDEAIRDELRPTLKLIIYIMEQYCKNESLQYRNELIPRLFLKNYHLEQIISSYIMIAKNKDLIFELQNITYLIYFVDLCIEAKEPTFKADSLIDVALKTFKLLSSDISRGISMNVIKGCYLCFQYWSMLKPRFPKMPTLMQDNPLIFESQMLVLMTLPLYLISIKYCGLTCDENQFDDFRDNFVTKIFKIMCQTTIRVCYTFRDQLLLEEDVFDLSIKSVSYVMQCVKHFNKEMGFIVFQTLIYSITDMVTAMKINPQLIEVCIKQPNYLYMLFDSLGKVIEEFKITWRDCVETICVMGIAIEFINITSWPTKVVVQALKIVNLSIAKYMSPNLALLVDRTYDSAMDSLGSLLTSQLEDERWEVRDTALEVLCTISDIAHTKFPSFQAVVLKAELPRHVTDMCTSDCQSFVRASALKCIKEMIVVPSFWSEAFDSVEILKKLQHILNEETEAIVRTEAAALVGKIYKHQSFPEDMKEQIYELMAYAATLDLHWEVKIKSLEFWDGVIKEQLKNQGMIDGGFPSVTFSKENRKIVSLTDAEVQRRLNKVLMQLGDCGCLGVLISAMQDDCDLEVVKQAVDITKNLVQLTKQYGICSSNCNRFERTLSTTPSCSSSNEPLSIEFLMDSRDSVAKCELPSPAASVVSFGSCRSTSSSVKIVSPTFFMQFVQQDLDELVNSRRTWLNGMDNFNSILDDMLKSYEDIHNDINRMDCY